MALVLTPEQEKALQILADREIARKATEDAVAIAEVNVSKLVAEKDAAIQAERQKADNAITAINQAYVIPLRDAAIALESAKTAVTNNVKAVDIAAIVTKTTEVISK